MYTCTFRDGLYEYGCVASETRVYTGPKNLAFEIVAQIIICLTTKNTRKGFGLVHTVGGAPAIDPSAKEAHRSGVGEGEKKAF